nr:MAG TPA: YfkB-like domain protein [Caudoviricetes sp.]
MWLSTNNPIKQQLKVNLYGCFPFIPCQSNP